MVNVLVSLILVLVALVPNLPPFLKTAQQGQCRDRIITGPLETAYLYQPETALDASSKANILHAYGNLPLLFIENRGQVDEKVRYYVKARGQTIYLTDDEIVFDFIRYQNTADAEVAHRQAERLVFSLGFTGANRNPAVDGKDKNTAVVNYFVGNNPMAWHSDIPTYHEVVYKEIYPSIDLRLYGKQGSLSYDFTVKPGADVNDIELRYNGIDGLFMEDGDLVASTCFGEIRQSKPFIFQETEDGRQEIAGSFRLAGTSTCGFDIRAYDSSRPLIIDPALAYSTYLGGRSGVPGADFANDIGLAIAVDSSGCAYITGSTFCTDFPTRNHFQGTHGGGFEDAFVTKIDTTKSGNASLIYSTYLGGNGMDRGYGIAVDASGCAYVTGYTASDNFPTQNPFQGAGGSGDAFVTKLNSGGNTLAYSTYLGDIYTDCGYAIAVDSSGCAYVTGETYSYEFPTQNPFQGMIGGISDAFVTKFNAAGNTLAYSTYLGGQGDDKGYGIAVNSSGCAYVTGYTASDNFPTQIPFQATRAGNSDAFVTKFNAVGNTLAYSTYLGGSGGDQGKGIAVDASGCAYVTGHTTSDNFPKQNPFQGTLNNPLLHGVLPNPGDAFVTRFNAAGNTLAYSTYLGGSDEDMANGIAVDASGCAYVTGYTTSDNFPTQIPFQATRAGSSDAFVTRFNAAGNTLAYSTYLGGSGEDMANGIAVDTSGCAYITGDTWSDNFPTLNPFQAARAGASDVFVTKIGEPDITVTPASANLGSAVVGGASAVQTVTISNVGTANLTIGNITLGGANANQFSIQNDNASGQVLAPGASRTLQVVFSPTSIGAKTAILSIPSNDPDENPVNVPLNGTGTQSTQAVATCTGTGNATFTTSSGNITGLTALCNTICGAPPLGFTFPHGFFSFSITNIAPGSTVIITITLPSAMPAGTQYWKCQNCSWINVTSLLGDNDGDNVLTLTIKDGDTGDADGVANGTIVDPGGPAIAGTTPAGPPRGSSFPPHLKLPPNITPTYLSFSPQQASAGQPVTITVNMVNTGEETGSCTVNLMINGQVEQNRTVSVAPTAAYPVHFTVIKTQPGTYAVDIGGQQGSFTILGAVDKGNKTTGYGLVAAIASCLLLLLSVLLVLVVKRRYEAY